MTPNKTLIPRNPIPSLFILKWVIYLAIIVAIAPVLWMWVAPESFELVAGKSLVDNYGGFDRLALWQRIAGFIVNLVPAVILVAALLHVLALVRFAEIGNWFDAACERHLTAGGKLMLWQIFASWLSHTALILVLTAANPPGKQELSISFSSDEIFGLLPALMALVLAHMVRAGRAQRDELDEIV